MTSPKFADGAAVLLRASGEAATVVRLMPANGVDPTNYYEVELTANPLRGGCVAEGALIAAPTPAPDTAPPQEPPQEPAPVAAPAQVVVAQSATPAPTPAPEPAPTDPATLIADAETLLHEAIADTAPAAPPAKPSRAE